MHFSRRAVWSTTGLVALVTTVAAQPLPSTNAPPENRFKLGDVIPTGKTAVEVMELRFSKRAEELATKCVIFNRQGELLTLDIGNTNSPAEKLRLNLATGELFASVGRVGNPAWRSSEDATQPIGTYEGYHWHHEVGEVDKGNIHVVSLWIYRLKPSGKIFWRIQDGETRNHRNVQSFDLTFQYQPKVAPSQRHTPTPRWWGR